MKTLPRFQTIDTQDFTNGKAAVWDAANFKFAPGDAGLGTPAIITGSFNVTGLGHNEKVEVLVDHHDAAIFLFCEYPVIITVPEGVIISVLARGHDNDSTNGQQFVLLIENGGDGSISYDYDGNFTVNWSRKGYV